MSDTSVMTPTTTDTVALGQSVPPFTPHAISVSLPKWLDNVDYEKGEKRVLDSMVSGYPRFFIHLNIQKLARICEQKFATREERAMLFPTLKIADLCRSFIYDHSEKAVRTRLVHFRIRPEDRVAVDNTSSLSLTPVDLHIILVPEDSFPLARQFWQHTGMGLSTRLADHCLSLLSAEPIPTTPTSPSARFKISHKHYAAKVASQPSSPITSEPPSPIENLTGDHSNYLEERYGRNLPISAAASAKRALRRRIAGVLVRDNLNDCGKEPCAGDENLELGPSIRGVPEVQESDVYLYPSGMAAIWNAHQLILAVRPSAKSVCFGFPYTDTLKILQKWGPGCHFYGHGLDSDIDEFENLLHNEHSQIPPVLALFTEFPSNPLLRSADLLRLRALADKYGFLLVIDETIGNFTNVETLKYADIVVSSLTKVFSGSANVMGGSLVLNPQGRYYSQLKTYMNSHFDDFYFGEDAIFMERNSRDFAMRSKVIDTNTEAICDFLRSRSGSPQSVVKEVFYPKYTTREHYEKCRIKANDREGGFGGLFSVTFTTLSASHAFFDALTCHKGPSLGTNFTLASPFVILAHFTELDWAAQYGVEEGLVRVSVGLEDIQTLLSIFDVALRAAESV